MKQFPRLLASTLAAAAMFGSVVGSQQPAAVAPTVLRGATVIDVVANTTVPDAVIVIEGDKIAAFGGRTTPIPAGAAVVDLPGKFIIPGLVDSHTHDQPFLGELFLNFGVTSVVGLGVRPVVGEAYWRNTQSPDFRAPRLFGTGRTNLNAFINTSMTREQVRAVTKLVVADLPLLNDYHGRNYAWHPIDDALVYMKGGQLFLVTVGQDGPGSPRRIGESLGALAPTLHWFTRDGKAVVVGTDPIDDKGYGDVRPRGLALIPLDGSAPTRFAIDSAWTFDDLVRADPRTLWQPDAASITALMTEVATGERGAVRFDTRSGKPTVLWKGRARLANAFGDTTHQSIFALYQDIRTAPNVYRFPANFASKDRVSHADDRLDGVAVGSADVFETVIPGYNGAIAKARTAVLLPPGAKRGDRLPAVVLMYPGGDRSRQAEVFGGGGDLTIPTLLFTSRGYAVVLATLPLGPNREAGNPLNEMIDELLPQVYRAAELGYVDVNRLAIAGQSFGGYGTGAIISGTNLFRAAVAVSGIYDLAGTYGYLDENGGSFWIGWSEAGQARMGTHPWANVMRYLENSPYYRADRIHTPLLLIHGDKDMAYHDAQKLFTALRRLDRPVQLATYGGMGHVIYEWTRPNAVDAARRIVGFVEDHLGGQPKAAPTPQ